MTRLIGLFVGLLFTCAAACPAVFEYVSPLDSRASIAIDTAIPSVAVGDVAEPAKICSNAVNWICVTSKAMTFAIPREVGANQRNWEYAGHRFAVSAVSDFTALGLRESSVLHITSVDGDRNFSFVYSPRVGLIAIRVMSPAGTNFYLSTTHTGFGVSGRAR